MHIKHKYYVDFLCNLDLSLVLLENVGVRPGRLEIESTSCS